MGGEASSPPPKILDNPPFPPRPPPPPKKRAPPRTKPDLPRRDRYDHFMTDGQAAQVCGGVILARLVVAIPRRIPRRNRSLQPLQDVVPQSRLMVVDENGGRDVHGTDQDNSLTHLARLHFL